MISSSEYIKFVKKYKWVYLNAIIVGLIAHMYAFTNKIINHDEINHFFDKGFSIDHGRWGLDILDYILPSFSVPWLNGIASLAIVSLAGILIIDTLHIKSRLGQNTLISLWVTFPSLTITYLYMYTSLAYAIALFLSIAAVWLIFSSNGNKALVLATTSLILSLSIYQAYIICTVSLIILTVFTKLISENCDMPVLRKSGIRCIAVLLVSGVLYSVITKAVFLIYGSGFGGYAHGALVQNEPLTLKLKIIASTLLLEIFSNKYDLMPDRASSVFFLIAICCSLGVFIVWLCKTNFKLRIKIAACILLLSLAFCVNSIFIIVNSYLPHTIVFYSFSFLLFIPIAICDRLKSFTIIRYVCGISLILLIAQYIYFSNTTYLYMDIQYRQLYAKSLVISNDIVRFQHIHADGNKVVLLGELEIEGSVSKKFENKYHYQDNHVVGTCLLRCGDIILEQFINEYVDMTIPFVIGVGQKQRESLNENPEIRSMCSYPNDGYIKAVDGYVVVKLSD